MSSDDRIIRLKLCEEHIENVALWVSQSNYWRRILFSAAYNQRILIKPDTICDVPNYIKNIILNYDLQFYASKVLDCPEDFDEGAIIFKFESVEFPEIVRYSGNYDGVSLL